MTPPPSLKSDESGNFTLDFTGGRRPDPIQYTFTPNRHPENRELDFCSVDFETYFTETYSLTRLSTWEYVNHHAFDCHTVSICVYRKGKPWSVWVGHPVDAPWADLPPVWISHNAGFDDLVHRKIISLGLVPPIRPKEWNCTADLSIFLQAGRSLADASFNLLGLVLDKSVRSKMQAGNATVKEIQEYAGDDATACAMLWYMYSHCWPEQEQLLSRMTRESGYRGVHIDAEACRRDIGKLEFEMFKIKKELPWGMKGSATSYKQLQTYCYKVGIHPPPNLDLDDPDTQAWHNQFKDRYQWVDRIREYTQCRQAVGTMQLFLARMRKDGTAPFTLMYYGAPHTKRWQSSQKLRIMNLNKDNVKGVSIRNKIIAEPGRVFIIADSAQIEPRVLNWLAGNEEFLEKCRQGLTPYEAFARAYMGYVKSGSLKKNDPALYALYKAQVLALGYQAGPPKFVFMAFDKCKLVVFEKEASMIGEKLDTWKVAAFEKEVKAGRLQPEHYQLIPSAVDCVRDFRKNSPLTTAFWRSCQDEMAHDVGGHHLVTLPSGSIIRYFNVRYGSDDNLYAEVVLNSKNKTHTSDFYGGKLAENRVQATSREVLAWHLVQIKEHVPEVWNKWHVYDEGIWSAPEKHADKHLKTILQIMHTSPPWAKGLPLAAEGAIHKEYTK